MCKVNYITEHSSFMKLAIQHELTANEIALYNVLLVYFNSLSSGNEWPQGFIGISNKKLLALLPFSEAILIRTRDMLQQRGLGIFSFIPGKGRGDAPQYCMHYFSLKERQSEGLPVMPSRVDTIPEEQPEQSMAASGAESAPLETKESAPAAESQAQQESAIAIEAELGRPLSAGERRILGVWLIKYAFKADIYVRAAALSALKDDPMQYMNKVLANWHTNGVPPAQTAGNRIRNPGKTVIHQDYSQRIYKEEEYNIWQPDFSKAVPADAFS